ncbi:MAG: bifunctional diaminohydroxyphosphoribosylaminopyrimidine deaminase/5-amino-6-(5-phosphoribosylamino)uracil reductase RibD, partial [Gemmataceae bacterium]
MPGSSEHDLVSMTEALTLAQKGEGWVEPNPMVGAVVVQQGIVVGRGWHQRFGGPHAEVHALAEAGAIARGATLYVTLEPCCHHGKTPPCTGAILAAGIARVVVGMQDPFPKVAGGGIAELRAAGVQVDVVADAQACWDCAAPYLMRQTQKRPWVHLKWAMSLDGKIATRTGHSKWITQPETRQIGHQLRGRMDAILVGAGTLRADDPLLTARPAGPRLATRIVITASGDLPRGTQLEATARNIPTLIVTSLPQSEKLKPWREAGAEVLSYSTETLLPELLHELAERGMTNILVEGGGQLAGAFHGAGLVDEI